VISPKLVAAYEKRQAIIEREHAKIADASSEYWWAMYEMYRDELWRARFETQEDWLGDWSASPSGRSKSTFYNVKDGIEAGFKVGLSEAEVRGQLLKGRKVATEGDFKQLFTREKGGKLGELRPEVVERIEAGGETPRQYLLRLAELPDGEARGAVQALTRTEQIFVHEKDVVVTDTMIAFNVQHESEKGGILYKGTVTLKISEITKPPRRKKANEIPPVLQAWLIRKFGLKP